MLAQRLFTAAVGVPILLYILLKSPPGVFAALIMGCIMMSVYEAAKIFFPKVRKSVQHQDGEARFDRMLVSCMGVSGAVFLISAFEASGQLEYVIVLGVIAIVVFAVFSAASPETSTANGIAGLVTYCYGCLPWLTVWDLHSMAPHGRFVLLLLVIVWCGDSGAYFGGRFFGKRPLWPARSPKKTWEGAFAGLGASILGAVLVNSFYDGGPGIELILVVAVVGNIAAQMGDLAESTFKRFADVKDSGAILPGHGGFLDRVDGVLLAGPVVWVLLNLQA